MNIKKLKPVKDDLVRVIIETPKGSQNKFVFDTALNLFRLKKTLPMGTVFPFDFGFIPKTRGGDGDPLDILVIMDEPAFPGCLVECRLLGVLKARQQDKRKKEEENDRLVSVADNSILYKDINEIKDLNKNMVDEISNFFVDYNKHEGKKFMPDKWEGKKTALKLVRKAMQSE